MKKAFVHFMALGVLFLSMSMPACKKDSYQVNQEEYEQAFTENALSNVTISVTGPYWERDQVCEYIYSTENAFAGYCYRNGVQYYGRYYGMENGEEFKYVYGSERYEDFTETSAYWRKYSMTSNTDNGISFVLWYKRDFHLLEYDSSTKSYRFDAHAGDVAGTYAYYFRNKKLTKFEITIENNDEYHYVWEFYDYGTTKIPVQAEMANNKALLIDCYEKKYPEAGKGEVIDYYGQYPSGALVAMLTGENMQYTESLWSENVAGYDFHYSNGNYICVLYQGEFYTLPQAYANGYLTEMNIADIANQRK
ncbi:MAG: hypothetical protein J6A38_00425 [Clostridia bacterium]|nr:hypothetical protein [Clostridia bacterium]